LQEVKIALLPRFGGALFFGRPGNKSPDWAPGLRSPTLLSFA